MTLVLQPFSAKGKRWEPHGQALRRLLNLTPPELLDPFGLAEKVGLKLVDVCELCEQLGPKITELVLIKDKDGWSGGVFARPLPDGKRVCILNSTHGPRRTKITLMEEIAHVHLKHTPTGLMRSADGFRMRGYDKTQEEDAYGVGAAALLPWASFFQAINRGATVKELAEQHDLSEQLIRYRIQITGAHRLYQARQR
jgi:hypothetical protein